MGAVTSSSGWIRLREYRGRFGNAVIEYAVVRNLAKHLNYEFVTPPLIIGSHIIDTLPYRKDDRTQQPPRRLKTVVIDTIHTLRIPRLQQPVMLELRGYLQNYAYIKDEQIRQEIRQKIRDCAIRHYGVAAITQFVGYTVVHIRSGDMWLYNTGGIKILPTQFALCIDFYMQVLQPNDEKIVFVTESLSDRYMNHFRALFPKAAFHSSDLLLDFVILLTASKLVMSMSTLSWCAAWLNDQASQIIYPVIGFWHPLCWEGNLLYSRGPIDNDKSNMFLNADNVVYYDFGFDRTKPWLGNEADFQRITTRTKNQTVFQSVGGYQELCAKYPSIQTVNVDYERS